MVAAIDLATHAAVGLATHAAGSSVADDDIRHIHYIRCIHFVRSASPSGHSNSFVHCFERGQNRQNGGRSLRVVQRKTARFCRQLCDHIGVSCHMHF